MPKNARQQDQRMPVEEGYRIQSQPQHANINHTLNPSLVKPPIPAPETKRRGQSNTPADSRCEPYFAFKPVVIFKNSCCQGCNTP